MRRRGVWPLRQTWWSVCSVHHEYNESCHICRAGTWRWDVLHWLGVATFAVSPRLWRLLANRHRWWG